jgi:MtrB/PioB family decaheme-associated outer membrane protein
MRITRALLTAALMVVPVTARAQPTAAQPAGVPPPAPAGWTGTVDFGVRGTTVDGDGARYERYRDLGGGAVLEGLRVNRQHNGWFLGVNADHVARRDQRYMVDLDRPGTFRSWFLWDQIPMLLSHMTRTLFTGVESGVLEIDNALQARVQADPAAIAPVFAQFGTEFETRTRRLIAEGGLEYLPSSALTVTATVRHTDRKGSIPFGGSFGHSSLVELPAPTEHRLMEANAGAEFVRNRLLLRAAYIGSFFHNDVTSVVFDNPFRAIDSASASSRGRLTLAPTNSYNGVNGLASVRLPGRSRASAFVSVGTLTDAGDPIVPQTINSALPPAPLERATVDGEAKTRAVNLTFVSRPTRYIDFTAGYRQYDFDNRTAEFAMTRRVSYDNAVSPVAPPVHTEPFGVARHTVDADLKLTPMRGISAGVGLTRIGEDRTHRIFESTTDNVVRVTFDTVSYQWFTLRTKYEHAQRRGSGIEEGERDLAAIGEQPGMRHFDIAARDRNRVTILGSVTPVANVGVSLSAAAGKDDYLQSLFGLRDNTHRVYGAGVDVTPTEQVALGASYSYERYNALSRSRQANPGAQFTDPSRNWATDATDGAHSWVMSADIGRIADKVDLRFAFDFSRARARYEYITGVVPDRTLPEEVVVLTALPTPVELPPTLSELQRGTIDATYALASRLSLGLSYWYERYRVNDFTLDADANPDLARGQALLMGYLYRPYTANTVWVRLFYRW